MYGKTRIIRTRRWIIFCLFAVVVVAVVVAVDVDVDVDINVDIGIDVDVLVSSSCLPFSSCCWSSPVSLFWFVAVIFPLRVAIGGNSIYDGRLNF